MSLPWWRRWKRVMLSQQKHTLLGKLLVYEELEQQWDIVTEFAFPQKDQDNGRAYLEEDMVSFLVLSHPDANRHVIGSSLIRSSECFGPTNDQDCSSPIVFPSENYTVRRVVKDYMRRWDKSQGRRPGWHFLFWPSHISANHLLCVLTNDDPQNTVQDLKLRQLSLDQLIPQDVRQKNSIDCGLFVVHAIAAMCSSMRVFATQCEHKYSTMAVMLSPEGEQELLNKTLVTEINTFLTSGASRVEKEWRRYTVSPGSMRVQAQAWLGEMLTATRERTK
eukprot:g12876.t1